MSDPLNTPTPTIRPPTHLASGGVVNASRMEAVLAATKRTVPAALLTQAMNLPWEQTRASRTELHAKLKLDRP